MPTTQWGQSQPMAKAKASAKAAVKVKAASKPTPALRGQKKVSVASGSAVPEVALAPPAGRAKSSKAGANEDMREVLRLMGSMHQEM